MKKYIFLSFFLFIATQAIGATITVTTGADSGPGSLRQAVLNAVNGDTIIFSPSVTLVTLATSTSEIIIDKSITIKGNGVSNTTVDGNANSRVFNIGNGTTVSILDMTIQRGSTASVGGGAIYSSGTLLLLTNVDVLNSQANNNGGGIYTIGKLTLTNVNVMNNQTFNGAGGGVYATSGTALRNVTISNNSTALSNGGGLYTSGLTNLETVTMENNSAGGNGGALYAVGNIIASENCLFNNNTAFGGNGGAIYLKPPADGPTFFGDGISSFIVSNNKSAGQGGGIYFDANGSTLRDLLLGGVTISGNIAKSHGGGISTSGALTLSGNTTISNNKAGYDIDAGTFSTAGNGGGIYAIAGLTLEGNVIVERDTANTDGGGIYKTGSPIISTALTSLVLNQNMTVTGNAGGLYSGSAFNLQNVSITNNSARGNGGGMFISAAATASTLKNSVVKNNSAKNIGGGIYTDASLLTLENDTISGNKAGYDAITEVYAGNNSGGGVYANRSLTLQGLIVLDKNIAAANGGGIYKNNTAATTFTGASLTSLIVNQNRTFNGFGGGIYSGTAFDLQNASFTKNQATQQAGGLYAALAATLTNATFSGNKAGTNGGAIYANNALTLAGSMFFENDTAMNSGGAIWKNSTGTFNTAGITSLTFNQNIAVTGTGGAIHTGASFAAQGWVISNNRSGTDGGGINVVTTTVPISFNNVSITNNTAGWNGGGISTNTAAAMNLTNSMVLNNAAKLAGGGIFSTGALTLAGKTEVSRNKAGWDASAIPPQFVYNSSSHGGGVYVVGTLNLQDSIIFANDSVVGEGGAIYSYTALNSTNLASLIIDGNMAGVANPGSLGSGGGIYATGLSLSLTNGNISITNNTALTGGGIYILSNTASITNAKISNNTSTISLGGGIHINNAACVANFTGLTLQNNIARTNGGAIYNVGDLILSGSTVSGNIALTNGGGISTIGKLTLENDTISNNKAGYDITTDTYIPNVGNGGGISIEYNFSPSLLLKGTITIENNTAGYLGGGISYGRVNTGFTTSGLTSLTIRGNEAKRFGGGIYTNSSFTLNAPGNKYIFSNNKAGMSGGAIFGEGSYITLDFTNIRIANNTAVSLGGGIAAYTTTSLRLANSSMTGNVATSNGGGAYVGNVLTLLNDTISDNKGLGGGVYVGSQLILQGNIVFERDTSISYGGAILKATPGGAITVTGLTSLVLNQNVATTEGGAIYTIVPLTLNAANHCTITNNKAGTNGGAIYANNILKLDSISILNNTASSNGGAIYKENSPSSIMEITGSTLAGNAAINGGAIFTSANNTSDLNRIINSTFSQNTASNRGGAIYSTSNSSAAAVDITFSTFNGNVASSGNGNAIYYANPASRILRGNIIYGNGSSGSEINSTTSLSAEYNIVRGQTLTGLGNQNIPAGQAANIFANISSGDLAVLANNGGPTQTYNIKKGGLAQNFIPANAILTPANWNVGLYDQRGVGYLRVIGGCGADVGALELQDSIQPLTGIYTIDTTQPTDLLAKRFHDLREAFSTLNAFGTGGAVTFQVVKSGVYQLLYPLELNTCVLHDFTFTKTTVDSVKILSPKTPSRAFIINTNVNVTIDGLVFDGDNVGSGIESYTDSILTIKNTIVRNNKTPIDVIGGAAGAALLARKGVIRISNSEFNNNAAPAAVNTTTNNGGAIFVDSTNTTIRVRELTIENSKFSNNYASGHGGAIYARGLFNTTIRKSDFVNNEAYTGAALSTNLTASNSIGNVTIDSCNFVANNAVYRGTQVTPVGGALYLAYYVDPSINKKAVITHSTFFKNKTITTATGNSYHGGALWLSSGTAEAARSQILNCTFDSNSTSAGNGGALYLQGYNMVKNSTFYANTTGAGPGTATSIGGAIYTDVLSSAYDTIIHCTFVRNKARTIGGAVANSSASFTPPFRGNLVVENPASPSNTTDIASQLSNVTFSTDTKVEVNTGQLPNYFADIDGGNNPILKNNGGFTPTLMLKYGGLAHNGILNYNVYPWRLAKDQRDSIRPIDCGAEFGAVEIQTELSHVFQFATTAVCSNTLIDADTLILSAQNMKDTVYYTTNAYTTIMPMPTQVTQGKIYVEFTATSNCKYRDSIQLSVSQSPVIKELADSLIRCSGDTIDLVVHVNNANGSDVVWSNYGSTGTGVVSAADTISTLTYASFSRTSDTTVYIYTSVNGLNACSSVIATDSLKMILKGKPTAVISNLSSTTGCAGSKVEFTLNTTNTSYIQWTGGLGGLQPARLITDQPETPDINETADQFEFSYTPLLSESNDTIRLALRSGNSVCPYNLDTLKIFVLPQPTSMGFELVTQPQDLQTICVDTLYELKVKATDLGGLKNIHVTLFDENITNIQVDSAEYKYPYNSGTFQSLGNYVDSVHHFKYLVPVTLQGNDSVLVRIHVKAICNFVSGDTIRFTSSAQNLCNLSLPSHVLSSKKYTLASDTSTLNDYTFNNVFGLTAINSQTSDEILVKMMLIVTGSQETDSVREKIMTFIPTGLVPIAASLVRGKNATGSVSVVPVTGGREFSMVIPSGIVPTDTIIYEYRVSAKTADCGKYNIRNQVYYLDSATCDTSCVINNVRATEEVEISVERYNFLLADTVEGETRLGLWGGKIHLFAINGFLAADSLKVDFYVDRDSNSYRSTADTLVATRWIKTLSNIPKGGILNVELSGIPVENARQLIAYSADSSLCDTIQFPITIITGLDTVCQNVMTIFEAAAGMLDYNVDVIAGATRVPITTIADYPKQNKIQVRFTTATGDVAIKGRYRRVIGSDTVTSEKTTFYTYVNPAAFHKGLKISGDTVCSPSVVKIYADSLRNVSTRLWTASTTAGSLSGGTTDTLTYSLFPRANDTTLWIHFTANGYSGCSGINDSIKLHIYAALKQGVLGGDTNCYNTSHRINFPAATGGHNNTYQWQDSTSTTVWTNILLNGTDTNYVTQVLTDSAWFRRIVTNSCGSSDTSTVALMYMLPIFSTGQIAAQGQTICAGDSLMSIGSNTNASGGNGNISYRWFVNSVEITDSVSATLTPTVTNAGVYIYTREAKDNLCNDFQRSAGAWVVTINDPLNGSYFINANGSGSGHFKSLKEAADRYNTCGISGNSRLIITSNLNEVETVEFKGTAPGSETYTLTIVSDGTKRIVKFKGN